MKIKELDRQKQSNPWRRLEKDLFWKFGQSASNNHESIATKSLKKYQSPEAAT